MAVEQQSQGKLKLGALADSQAAHFLADHRGQSLTIEAIVEGLATHAIGDGVPLMRMSVSLSDYHPELIGRAYAWSKTQGIEITDRAYTPKRSETYMGSPIRVIHEGADALRRRLEGPEAVLDFAIAHELKAQGATDYIGMALTFSDGTRHFVSWVTDRAGGFSTAELTYFDLLLPLMCMRFELAHARRITEQLLNTYLGSDATRRIMSGDIRRSLGEDIAAVIFYCDLRGFTRLTDTLPPSDVIAVLGEYYDAVAGAVRLHGGDVIKMIGDGMIAIFPVRDGMDPGKAAREAVDAARDARASLEAIPPERLPEGVDKLAAGFALHVGQVTFGNIGSKDRLDFTVIGPAVNEVTRVEPLTKVLGHSLLMSADFAKLPSGLSLRSLGFHVLRGVRSPREIFTTSD
ncbi:MAG: adenylate/guanylate cyclase domain-containing protein [Alphaproteobacteria bacterium]|nr:adenylate/guanylate cyclase domain-containing protein [Alphaproteobacteria bacterium]